MEASDTRTATRALTSPWIVFGAAVALCWVVLVRHHLSSHASAHVEEPITVLAMWALMAVAMMAPTAVPVLVSLRELLGSTPTRPWWAFVGGYIAVWIGFAVVATALQLRLVDLDVIGAGGASTSAVFSAVLLAGAGVYQWTSLKRRCLTQCVNPMTFFFRFWRDGATGGARMGVRHGLACLGCCWALMLLAFVGGVANIWLMVVAAVLMTIEKLPLTSRAVTTVLGVALLAGAAVVLAVGVSGDQPPSHHHPMHSSPTEGTPWNPGHSRAN